MRILEKQIYDLEEKNSIGDNQLKFLESEIKRV